MMIKKGIHSNLAIPPGEYLEEVLSELGMTKEELARRMERPAPKLSAIFKGEKAITPDTALRLERVLGVPAHVWIGLETEYRLTMARQAEKKGEDRQQEEARLLSRYPYKELVRAGQIESYTHPEEKVRALQEYLGVMSLTMVSDLQRYRVAFRSGKSQKGERRPEAVAAWLRMGERRAQETHCSPFNEKRLTSAVGRFRTMTLRTPDEFQEPLERELAASGVALVICPHFPKTKTSGAVFWLNREKAVLMITVRGKWTDIFWFSLFHEIGHILLHNRQGVILEDDDDNQQETEADEFAADTLIPPEAYNGFAQQGVYNESAIKEFAQKTGVDAGIIVGRLQHDGKIPNNTSVNRLRCRYSLKDHGLIMRI